MDSSRPSFEFAEVPHLPRTSHLGALTSIPLLGKQLLDTMPYTNEPIAVVGSGCRFPGNSSNTSKLWDLLQDPRDVQSKIDRFSAENFYNEDGHYHGASNVLAAYLLSEDPKLFDTQFFNIALNEAEAIDPQQRLLMETVYESLETAGLSIGSLSGSNTAVYVGVMCDDFSQIGMPTFDCLDALIIN